MRDARPSLGASEIKARLRSTAVDWGLRDSGMTFGSRGPDLDFGWGRLDAYRALRAAGASGLDGPPPVPTHRVLEGTFTASVRKREFPLEIRNRCVPIAGSLIMPRWNGYTGSYDFDFFLRDPSGRRIAWGDSIERQDDLDSKPSTRSDIESPRPAETGTYTVEVEAVEGSGNYFIDVSAGLSDPPPGSPSSCGPPEPDSSLPSP